MGMLMSLFMYAVGLFILYLIITVAVRHGIDNSETARLLREKYGAADKRDVNFPKDDLDKD